jgi:glycosyltransferase involved in cell wall biosynthesis
MLPEATSVLMSGTGQKKVVFCIPIVGKPYDVCVQSLEASLPLLEAAGYSHGLAQILNYPYISAARATMLRSALDAKADVIVFIDYDMSWDPPDMLKLIETEGLVVAGTYRMKIDDEQYMGTIETDENLRPITRADGCIKAKTIPAGFLKITPETVDKFMDAYPELCYGPWHHLAVDLFNHGVHNRLWWGEDYSFARRWNEKCGDVWIVPDLNLDHSTKDKMFKGNFHHFLMRQPGGSNDPART